MSSKLPTVLTTLVLSGLTLLLGCLAIAWSGWINVSALNQESGPVRWFLHLAMEQSVERHSNLAQIPPKPWGQEDPGESHLQSGFSHFRAMCATCHGGPGVQRSEIGQGLNPSAPSLHKKRLEERELFWLIENGVRMTGMPAFGKTHDSEAIWNIVAFVQQMGEQGPEAYQERLEHAGIQKETQHFHQDEPESLERKETDHHGDADSHEHSSHRH